MRMNMTPQGLMVDGMHGMAPQGGLEPPTVGVEARCSSNRAATADGTAGRGRTGTLPVRTGMLVRLSCCGMASRGGLEPPTSGFGGRCSSDWATTTVGLEGWIRTIVAGSVDRHPSVRRPREMDPAAGVEPASPPWHGGVVAVGQREDGTDDRNRTRLDWFWKPAPTQSATSVEIRPAPAQTPLGYAPFPGRAAGCSQIPSQVETVQMAESAGFAPADPGVSETTG